MIVESIREDSDFLNVFCHFSYELIILFCFVYLQIAFLIVFSEKGIDMENAWH